MIDFLALLDEFKGDGLVGFLNSDWFSRDKVNSTDMN